MKTTEQIIQDNQKVEYTEDSFGRDRERLVYNDYHSDDKNKKWYSEERVKKIFEKFDKYSCIKNDKWYLELKEHFLKTGELK